MGFRVEIEFDDGVGNEIRTVKTCLRLTDLPRAVSEALMVMQRACAKTKELIDPDEFLNKPYSQQRIENDG